MTSWGLAARSTALVAMLIALTACTSGPMNEAVGQGRPPATRGAGASFPFSLYTHCGIDELRLDGKFYERVGGPLDDGNDKDRKSVV